MNKVDLAIIKSEIKRLNPKSIVMSLVGLAVVTMGTIAISTPAMAQGNGNEDYLEEIKTKLAGVDDVGNNVYLVSAGSIAFQGGCKVGKRILFA